MSTGEVQKRFDAHKSLGPNGSNNNNTNGMNKPDKPPSTKETLDNLKSKDKESSSSGRSSSNKRERPFSKSENSKTSSKSAPSPVPRRTKTSSRVKSDGKEEKESSKDKDGKDSSKEKDRKGVSRSKSSSSGKREKSTRGERSISRNGSLRRMGSHDENTSKNAMKDLVAPSSPLRSIVDSTMNGSSGNNHTKSPERRKDMKKRISAKNLDGGKSMDEMVSLAWFKPKDKEKKDSNKKDKKEKDSSSSKKDKDSSSSKKKDKDGSTKSEKSKKDKKEKDKDLKSADEKSTHKKKSDEKNSSSKKKGRKNNNGKEMEDNSVNSAVVKPKTSKVSASEWDEISQSDKEFVTKVPQRKMSWFGFSSATAKDDSSCDGSFSGLDLSFSSVEGGNDMDDSLSVMDLMMNASPGGGKDNNHNDDNSDSLSSDDESSDDEDSSSDVSSDDGKGADKDAKAARKRASKLRKLQRKKKREEKQKKRLARQRSNNGERRASGASRDGNPRRRGGPGAAAGNRSFVRDDRNRRRPDNRGHHSIGPGRNPKPRQGQDPFGFGDSYHQRGNNQWPADDDFDDFNGSQRSFRGGDGSNRYNNRAGGGAPLGRSRSFDDTGGRFDDRDPNRRPRRVQRSQSGHGDKYNGNRPTNFDGGSRRGRRTAGGDPFDDGGSRRGRRTVDYGSDMDNSRRNRRGGGGGDNMDGSRRGRRTADDHLNGSRHGRDMDGGSRRGRRTVGAGGGDPFDGGGGSRHGRRTVGAGGGDPFDDWNGSMSGHNRGGGFGDPFASSDPFDDFNNSRSSNFDGNSSSRGTGGRRGRGYDLQNDALMKSLNESSDQLAFVQAGKWMTDKEREANAPPKIQAWEKRRNKR